MDSLTPCPSPAPFQNLNKYDLRNPTHLLQLSLVVMEVSDIIFVNCHLERSWHWDINDKYPPHPLCCEGALYTSRIFPFRFVRLFYLPPPPSFFSKPRSPSLLLERFYCVIKKFHRSKISRAMSIGPNRSRIKILGLLFFVFFCNCVKKF